MLICFDPAIEAARVPFDVHFAGNSPFGVGLKYFFFHFQFSRRLATFFFFHENVSKKVDPQLR